MVLWEFLGLSRGTQTVFSVHMISRREAVPSSGGGGGGQFYL